MKFVGALILAVILPVSSYANDKILCSLQVGSINNYFLIEPNEKTFSQVSHDVEGVRFTFTTMKRGPLTADLPGNPTLIRLEVDKINNGGNHYISQATFLSPFIILKVQPTAHEERFIEVFCSKEPVQ